MMYFNKNKNEYFWKTIYICSLVFLVSQLSFAQVLPQEKDALIALYESTNGDNWTYNTNWLSDKPVSEWYGVSVVNNKIERITLRNNNLEGTLPDEIGELEGLKYLVLSKNKISDNIPLGMSDLDNLEELYLDNNLLEGNISIYLGLINNLKVLNLERNNLTGEIPSNISSLKNLKTFIANNNKLNGGLHHLLQLNNIEEVQLKFNDFASFPDEGIIPGVAGGVIELMLGYNDIAGEIPLYITNFNRLRVLEIQNNNLIGTIPSEISNLTNLSILNLGANKFEGEIPREVSELTNLTELKLEANKLTGTIPNLDQLLKLKKLILNSNKLSGNIPAINHLSELTHLILTSNELEGNIPSIGQLTKLTILNLGNNKLTGNIPFEIGNLESISFITLSLNNFTGYIPDNFGKLKKLKNLMLNQNELEGNLPESLSEAVSLEFLVANNNNITGGIPEEFSQLTKLKTVELRNNKMQGKVPASFLGLSNLATLNIHHNEFRFSDLEDFNQLPNVYNYIPQSKVDNIEEFVVEEGETLVLTSGDLSSSNNSYQWYKDGVALRGIRRNYIITDIKAEDAGIYHFIATNSKVTGLSLEREPITVRVVPSTQNDDCEILSDRISFDNCYNFLGQVLDLESGCSGWEEVSNTTTHLLSDYNRNAIQGVTQGGVIVEAIATGDRIDPFTHLPVRGARHFKKEITGLEIGETYIVSFYGANTTDIEAYQESFEGGAGFDGDSINIEGLTGNWEVSLDDDYKDGGSLVVNEIPQWEKQEVEFIAQAETQWLAFRAERIYYEANFPSNRFDVFLVIDGISIRNKKCNNTTEVLEQVFCNIEKVATINSLSSPMAGQQVTWYEVPSGGSALSSTTILETKTYYAQGNDVDRIGISVIVGDSYPIDEDLYDYQEFEISSNPTIADLQPGDSDILWYDQAVGGTILRDNETLVNERIYYAQKGKSGCRLPVEVFVGVKDIVGDGKQDFCIADNPTLASIDLEELPNGYSYKWYDVEVGGTVLSETTPLIHESTYYVVKVDSLGNESTRRSIYVLVHEIASPVVFNTEQIFYTDEPVTVSDLVALGDNIVWYETATGGSVLSDHQELEDGGTYYAAQSTQGCESKIRIAVTVRILPEEAPTMIACEKFRPQPGETYVISGWVREEGLQITSSEIRNFTTVKELFVKLLNHLKDKMLSDNNSNRHFPSKYKPSPDTREFDELVPYVKGSTEKNLIVYNFKPIKESQEAGGIAHTIGFSFALSSDNNAARFEYRVPKVVGKSYRYPMLHNSTLKINFTNAVITGSSLRIDSSFEIEGGTLSYQTTNYVVTTVLGVEQEIEFFNYEADPNYEAIAYANSLLKLTYRNASDEVIEFTNEDQIKFKPKGAIIEGWQRISSRFKIPVEATNMIISLENTLDVSQPNKNVYFDDVRIHPEEGNMKSFVYDPLTQRLMAEMDENNYATYYEYDKEGGLVRVKKETERGVFTIQETRSSNIKR